MRVENPELLASYHVPGKCWICGKYCKELEPHHVRFRGSGRIDVPENIIAVGASKPYPLCPCHAQIQDGFWEGVYIGPEKVREKCFEIVGKRIGKSGDECDEKVLRLRREDKCSVWLIEPKEDAK